MKTKISITLATGFCVLCLSLQSGRAQGSLTPPGAPAQSMKSLDQIEPRIPISYAGEAILAPGSYYLTTNLVGSSGLNGLTIYSGEVTLDLNGFTLQGVSGSHSGIYLAGSYVNITIKNGIINGWGGNGVDTYSIGGTPRSIVLRDLTVTANGNDGLSIADGCTVANCSVSYNNFYGIFVNGAGSQVKDNTLIGNNATASGNSAAIFIEGSNNRIEGNHVTASGTIGYGIEVFNTGSATNNIIIKNSVEGGGANNYFIAPNNDAGPVGTAATATSPWANLSH